jgi:hypothetical protein
MLRSTTVPQPLRKVTSSPVGFQIHPIGSPVRVVGWRCCCLAGVGVHRAPNWAPNFCLLLPTVRCSLPGVRNNGARFLPNPEMILHWQIGGSCAFLELVCTAGVHGKCGGSGPISDRRIVPR